MSIPCERVLGVDRENVDDALRMVALSKSLGYNIDERKYVRKVQSTKRTKKLASKTHRSPSTQWRT